MTTRTAPAVAAGLAVGLVLAAAAWTVVTGDPRPERVSRTAVEVPDGAKGSDEGEEAGSAPAGSDLAAAVPVAVTDADDAKADDETGDDGDDGNAGDANADATADYEDARAAAPAATTTRPRSGDDGPAPGVVSVDRQTEPRTAPRTAPATGQATGPGATTSTTSPAGGADDESDDHGDD